MSQITRLFDGTILPDIEQLQGDTGPAVGGLTVNVLGGSPAAMGRNLVTEGVLPSTLWVGMKNAITLGDLTPLSPTVPSLTLATGSIFLSDTASGTQRIHWTGPIARMDGDSDAPTTNGHLMWASTGTRATHLGWGVPGTDATSADNTFMGYNCYNQVTAGTAINTAMGSMVGENLTAVSQFNTNIGGYSLQLAGSSQYNTTLGFASLGAIRNGNRNIALGPNAGINYTSAESDNILIGNEGVVGENNTIRIGQSGAVPFGQTRCFVAGVENINVGSVAKVVSVNANQLGSTTLTAGTNISITPGANTITISAIAGAIIYNYTGITHADTPYTVTATDDVIGADVTAGVITIRVPNAPSTGRTFTIKDISGLAAASNITITTPGGIVNIDDATTFVIDTAYQAVEIMFNGTKYIII